MIRYDIAQDLIARFYPEITEPMVINIEHKALKQDARFYKDTIYLNFANDICYLWAGIGHESSHILIRKAGWEQSEAYKELKRKKLNYDVDQSCAILVQAYYENLAGIRRLEWSEWHLTFSCMQVEKIGKLLFEKFVVEVGIKDFSIAEFISKNRDSVYKSRKD